MPNRNRAISPDKKTALGVDCVEAPAHIVDVRAVARERVRLKIDVAEIDQPGPSRLDKSTMLPCDTGITDRAFGIVPNGEFWICHLPWPANIGIAGSCRA